MRALPPWPCSPSCWAPAGRNSQTAVAPPLRPVLSVVAMVHTTDTLGPFVGSIQPRYKTDLGFRIFGRMVARFVDVGAVVTKGQEIAALDPAVQALAVRSAEAPSPTPRRSSPMPRPRRRASTISSSATSRRRRSRPHASATARPPRPT